MEHSLAILHGLFYIHLSLFHGHLELFISDQLLHKWQNISLLIFEDSYVK